MTTEETRDAVKVMEAYANGKKIQYLDNNNKWIDAYNPVFDWYNCAYRIKPEPKYRPFKNQEECWEEMHKHPDFGWVRLKINSSLYHIDTVGGNNLIHIDNAYKGLKAVFQSFEFTDGAPFGIKDE